MARQEQSLLTLYKASAGSGKTFTLAVRYIAMVVREPSDYRHILAVTFTNKATAEMKQRILSQLYGIGNGLEESGKGERVPARKIHREHNQGECQKSLGPYTE